MTIVRRKIKDLIADKAILDVQDGNHGEKHPTAADYVEEGIPFLMARDFQDGQVDLRGACKISKSLGDSLRIGFARTGDVLLTHKGSIGLVAIVPEVPDYVMLTPQVTYYRTNPTKLLNSYLKYAFQSPSFRDQLNSFSAQSTRPYIGITAQKELQLDIPPLPMQRRVAGILSVYDELIENYQRRVRILDTIARDLYREWFVRFRFPGHEKHPCITSPLGDIPKGWEVKLVKRILSRRAAGTVYREADVKPEGAIPVLDQSTSELLGFHDNEPDHLASLTMPMAIFGDHTCKMQLLIEPFSVGPNVVPFATGIGLPTTYVFYAVNSLVQTQEYKRHWIPLNAKEIVVADRVTAERFASMIQPMLVAQEMFKKMIRNLRRTRDLLLPRLISGPHQMVEDITA